MIILLTALVAGGVGAVVYQHMTQQNMHRQLAEHHARLMALEGKSVQLPPPDAKVQ